MLILDISIYCVNILFLANMSRKFVHLYKEWYMFRRSYIRTFVAGLENGMEEAAARLDEMVATLGDIEICDWCDSIYSDDQIRDPRYPGPRMVRVITFVPKKTRSKTEKQIKTTPVPPSELPSRQPAPIVRTPVPPRSAPITRTPVPATTPVRKPERE